MLRQCAQLTYVRFVLDMKIKTPDGDPYVHGVAVYDGHSGGACADYVVVLLLVAGVGMTSNNWRAGRTSGQDYYTVFAG